MKKLAIIGLGLMGGSLGLAVKRRGLVESVCGYARREENRRSALKRGVVDSVFDSAEAAVRDADFVVFCVPVLAIAGLASVCKAHFSNNCVVTDVGSTKANLVSELTPLFKDIPVTFVGSHPIAGSEQSGLDAARADLYDGSVVVVTAEAGGGAARGQRSRRWRDKSKACPAPSGVRDQGIEDREGSAVAMVAEFWEGLGAEVVVMDPAEHDRIIARTSHLPHLIAAMLVSSVHRDGGDQIRKFCGTGFYDTTRIAGGSEKIWHDIVKSNRSCVSRELGEFREVFDHVKAMIDKGDFDGVRHFLAESRRFRQRFSGRKDTT